MVYLPYYLNFYHWAKFFKFHPCQRFDEDVSKLFLCLDEVNLDVPLICTFSDVVESDFYVLRYTPTISRCSSWPCMYMSCSEAQHLNFLATVRYCRASHSRLMVLVEACRVPCAGAVPCQNYRCPRSQVVVKRRWFPSALRWGKRTSRPCGGPP